MHFIKYVNYLIYQRETMLQAILLGTPSWDLKQNQEALIK
jgi:hypothetical protein